MIITCKACNTSFNLDEKMLKPTGSKVRCSVCAKVFTAFPQQAPTPEPVESEPAPETELKPESDSAAADAIDGQLPETDILDEDTGASFVESPDLDFVIEDEPEAGVSDVEIEDAVSDVLNEDFSNLADESGETVIVSLDDDDLDLSLDGQPDVVDTVIADLDKEDFDLDPPRDTDGDPEGTATVIANLDDDALDLDIDFSLESEAADESMTSVGDALPETLGDLDDLDDLDLTLGLDDADAGDVGIAAEVPELADDLDLSSLESLLENDDEDDDKVTMIVDGGEEPDLTLDLGDKTPIAEGDAAGSSENTLEDLEFDLDTDGGAETIGLDDDQEVDLSEIEKMLEEPEKESPGLSTVPEQDLDLDIEASLETEKWMSESGKNNMRVKDEELDLSELEQVLDDVDTDEFDEPLEEPELALASGDGEAPGTPTETVAIDDDLEFDLSDFEDDVPLHAGTEKASNESADMSLAFELEEDSQAEPTLEPERHEEIVPILDPSVEKVEKAPPEPIKTTTPPPKPKPVKKGVSKSMIFLLIIAILGGGGYGAYYLMDQKGIDIPFLSNYLRPKVDDPGYLKLTTDDINSKFVDNAGVGKLFVITGKVKNGYAENRGMITLLGKLFSTGKVPVNQEKVYCGNVMSDLELANLEWDKIQARLSNRLGDNRSNVKIEPGKSIPFMVVFSGLPDDLEEFTIEVTGSTILK